ncbi:SatD family protein [Sediminibacter sp. Hel_I_10]|uniref:SatD family protein n=1 Tax=Sediminibacter sp. Hel_I_10 TaxID=1392490 RepID=UPI00047AC2ED|nr:SatD family protein [Sediminibacter sp. Hel_I_10]
MKTAILTGDMVNSQNSDPDKWVDVLKTVLNVFGNAPTDWELYRGDSFQLETQPEKALYAALMIKAHLKFQSDLDVRIAIGIGEKTYNAEKITASNGTAFINSGHSFEQLKKNNLAIKTEDSDLDNTLNLMFQLASVTIDNWTSTVAELIELALTYPDYNQQQIAKRLQTTQSNVSQGLKRGGFDELSKLLAYYKSQISTL